MEILFGVLILLTVLLTIACLYLWKQYKFLKDTIKDKNKKHSKLLSQKKQSEIRTGLIAEKLAPFVDGFNYNPNNLIFLGNPIDYIVFNDDEIVFLEVKSGKSKLTKSQRTVRDHIKNGNIKWEVFRIE